MSAHSLARLIPHKSCVWNVSSGPLGFPPAGLASIPTAETVLHKTSENNLMQISYLEIVTPDVDAVCTTYSKLHGVTFDDGDPVLGGARTTKLAGGGTLGVRAPMHAAERPVVRPYVLVEDIESAVAAATEAGAEIAVPPMKLEGHGTCAIYFQGGVECALWQL